MQQEAARMDPSQGLRCTLLPMSNLVTYLPKIKFIYQALFYIKCHKIR